MRELTIIIMKYQIELSLEILAGAPDLKVIQIEAALTNSATSDLLKQELEKAADSYASLVTIDKVNKRPGIAATRAAYKSLGKDPNRYRPSAEALCRRIVNGKGLYYISTLVDVINLLSIHTGYSIGGFDADKIQGDRLVLGVGKEGEVFNAIGRGVLNIAGLPVYRDSYGSIGTPTSDEERTKITDSTSRLLMLVNVYGDDVSVDETVNMARDLLSRHAALEDFQWQIVAR